VGAQQIRLQANAVAVAAGELPYRLDALIQQQPAHRQAAHPHHGTAAIGHVHSVHPALQGPRMGQGAAGITTTRWHHLRRDGEGAHLQCLLQPQNARGSDRAIINHRPETTAPISGPVRPGALSLE